MISMKSIKNILFSKGVKIIGALLIYYIVIKNMPLFLATEMLDPVMKDIVNLIIFIIFALCYCYFAIFKSQEYSYDAFINNEEKTWWNYVKAFSVRAIIYFPLISYVLGSINNVISMQYSYFFPIIRKILEEKFLLSKETVIHDMSKGNEINVAFLVIFVLVIIRICINENQKKSSFESKKFKFMYLEIIIISWVSYFYILTILFFKYYERGYIPSLDTLSDVTAIAYSIILFQLIILCFFILLYILLTLLFIWSKKIISIPILLYNAYNKNRNLLLCEFNKIFIEKKRKENISEAMKFFEEYENLPDGVRKNIQKKDLEKIKTKLNIIDIMESDLRESFNMYCLYIGFLVSLGGLYIAFKSGHFDKLNIIMDYIKKFEGVLDSIFPGFIVYFVLIISFAIFQFYLYFCYIDLRKNKQVVISILKLVDLDILK